MTDSRRKMIQEQLGKTKWSIEYHKTELFKAQILHDALEAQLADDPDHLPAEAYDPNDSRDIGYGEPR